MTLEAAYKQWLGQPTADALAVDASLVYVPTLTTIHEPAAILKHIKLQDQQLQKKSENTLNAIENGNALCLQTETTLHLTFGGGAYLPGMDDNLLADKTVFIVMVRHVASIIL